MYATHALPSRNWSSHLLSPFDIYVCVVVMGPLLPSLGRVGRVSLTRSRTT
jgi:hypothetical protein